jgi:hypothetical protein
MRINKMNVLCVMGVVLILAGCDAESKYGDGTLSLKTKVAFGTTDGKEVRLPPADYLAFVTLNQNDVILTVNTTADNYHVYLPGIVANLDNAQISISGNSIGQSFDLIGSVQAIHKNFDHVVEHSCEYKTELKSTCHWETESSGGRQKCRNQWATIYGKYSLREIGYKDYKNISIDLVNEGVKVGNFSGDWDSQEVITHSEMVAKCHL